MTTLSKIIRGTILLCFLFFTIITYINHQALSFSIDDLAEMEKNGFSEVFVTKNGQKYIIDKEQTRRLIQVISEMPEQLWVGWKGEASEEYCSLNFQNKNETVLYRINFSIRPSMEGKILARLEVISGNSTNYYDKFNGNRVVDLLNEITHGKCIKSNYH